MTGQQVPWDPRLSAWLDAVEAHWTEMGLSPLACGELRARLVEDLVGAMVGGAPVDELTAADPVGFASDVSAAAGYDLPPTIAGPTRSSRPRLDPFEGLSERMRFVLTALAGAMVGAILGWVTVVPVGGELIGLAYPLVGTGAGLLTLVMWAVYALAVACCAGLAVSLQFRDSPVRRRLSRSAILALLVSGAAITLPTIAFAWTTHFSTLPGVVMIEAAIVVVALVVGLILAGELSWRRLEPRLTRR